MYPVCFRLGSFVIYWYGILVAAGVFAGGLMLQKNASRRGYSPELISKLVFWVILWGIIGGRFLHVIVQMPYYYRRPFEILSIRNGGLAVEGAVVAGLIFLAIYSKIRKFNMLEILDIVAMPMSLGQAIGRIGCFLNGCCYGKPTDTFPGVLFPHLTEKVHPTQLYYSVTYIILFFVLRTIYKKGLKPGMVFATYILGFASIRYIVDMLRGDLFLTSLGLYPTQIISIALFLTGGIWFFSILREQ